MSESSTKGRHTTTSSDLYRLPEGTTIIDTPGIRQFGLWDIARKDLASYFPDFQDAARECRFADCTHSVEPGCGVRAGVDRGRIEGRRYDTYRRILDTL